jgi:hypothetical protein
MLYLNTASGGRNTWYKNKYLGLMYSVRLLFTLPQQSQIGGRRFAKHTGIFTAKL